MTTPARPAPAETAIPGYWESDVVLADGGTVHLRPRHDGDHDAIVDLYAHMSDHSRYLRFAGPTTSDRAGELESKATVDLDHHFSVVAELGTRIVGVAGYFREDADRAEVAFAVADDQQGRGLGTIMLEYLAAAALEQGIHQFVAWVLSGNQKMLKVFRSAGFEIHKTSDGGTVEITFDIAPTPGSIAARQAREHSAEASSIARLLRPRSIAVIGANREPGSIGHAVFRNLIDGEFTGAVYPVNPRAGSVAGVRAYQSVQEIPDPVDLAIVATPAETVLDVVEECGHAGIGGLVVISAGFAEVAGGREREQEMVNLARRNGMRVIGPNCMGVLNTAPDVRMNASFTPYQPRPGHVAFASQSGGLGIALLGRGAARGLGISAFVSMGNKADVSSNDLIQYWEEDPETDVILLYLESFGNPGKFARLARRISRKKPIIAVKSGRTPAGARGAGSHTAALAAPDVAVDALFEQAGVVRVDTLEELFDTAMLLSHQPLPKGRRVAIVSNGGGPGVIAADACVARGLLVPELSARTRARLTPHLPPDASLHNPIDLVAGAEGPVFEHALRVLLADDEIDAIIVIHVPPLVDTTDAVGAAILAATDRPDPTTPVLGCFLDPAGRRDLEHPDGTGRIPTFAYPEAAAVALDRAARLAEWRDRPEGRVPVIPGVDLARARAVVDRELADHPEGVWLSSATARSLLEPVGVEVVADWAADAVGSTTEPGRSPGAGGIETIVGVTRDPVFGSLVLFGMGGYAAELTRDAALRIVPLTDRDAHDLVRSLRSSPLFFGYRDTPPVDVDALESLLVRIGLLAEHVPEIAELDCNPVIVRADGAFVVDLQVHLAPHQPDAPEGLRRLRPTNP